MTKHWLRLALLGSAVLAALGGCASYAPVETPTNLPAPGQYGTRDINSYPRTAEAASGPAAMDLLKQSRVELANGRPEKAVATLELALNIEPRNPFIWEELAAAHLARHLPEEAEYVAVRSNSFAHGNPFIELENWRTIAQARQQRGDKTGAAEAADRVAQLQERVAD